MIKHIHLAITSRCNLGCPRCFYRYSGNVEISFHKITELFKDWKEYGITRVAIGGGEPLLHPQIESIVDLGMKLFESLTITTNGTILKKIKPSAIHISVDRLHPTWESQIVDRAIEFYKAITKVGINHIITDEDAIIRVKRYDVDQFLFILEKPISRFVDFARIRGLLERCLIDSCLAKLLVPNYVCPQGLISIHIDPFLKYAICSNSSERSDLIPLEKIQIKGKCPLKPGFKKPKEALEERGEE